MRPASFAKWLKGIIIGTTLIGIGCCVYGIPMIMDWFMTDFPEFAYWVLPWKSLLYCCAIPCFIAMVLSWKIASNIQEDKSFCYENARLFHIFSYLALGDTVVFLTGSIIFMILEMNHPGLLIIEILIAFVGLAVCVCTAALSFLVAQAAQLQEDNDLTI